MENNEKEQRFFSPDAIALMSILPKGLTEEYQEKAFKVLGRTKEELAASDLLESLIDLKWLINNWATNEELLESICNKANNTINKATK